MSKFDHNFDAVAEPEDEKAKASRGRIRSLFERYPNIDSDEKREIVEYLRYGPLLDIGLLKGDETIRYKIAAFEDDHRTSLRTTPIEMIVLIVIFAIAALVCSALWDMGQ